MNAQRIDVLTVMDEAASGLSLADERSYGAGDELLEARSAVAELIEAANEYVISYLQDASNPSSSTDEATRLILALVRIERAA